MSRTAKNVLYNLLGQGLLLVIGLASAKLMVGNLSQDVFGLISFAQLLNVTISSVIITGIGLHVVRDVSQYLESDRAYVEQLLQTSSLLYWGCALIIAALLWLFAPWIARHWLEFESLPLDSAVTLLRILGIGALLAFPTALYGAVLRGMEQMRAPNVIDVGRTFAHYAGVIILLLYGASAYTVAGWIVLTHLLAVVAYLAVLLRQFRPAAVLPVLHMPVLRHNPRLVRDFSILSVTMMLQRQADRMLVSVLLPVAALGYYNFAYQLLERPMFLRSAVATAIYPTITRLSAAKDDAQLLQQYHKWFDLVSLSLTPILAAALYIMLPLFSYVFDAGVADRMIMPVVFITLGAVLFNTLTVPHVTAMAVGRPDIMTRVTFYSMLITLPLTYLLILQFGLAGAATSWLLFQLLALVLFVPPFCRECLSIAPRQWYAGAGRTLLAAILPYGLGYAATVMTQTADDWRVLAGVYLAATALFAVFAYRIASAEFRATVLQTLRRLPQMWQSLLHSARPAHRPQG